MSQHSSDARNAGSRLSRVYHDVPSPIHSEDIVAPTEDDLLVAREVAALLRVTTAWVYAETRRGALPHVRLGRYVRYRRGTLLDWLAEQEERRPGSGTSLAARRPHRALVRR